MDMIIGRIAYLLEKWLIVPFCIVAGVINCYRAFLKRNDITSFRIRDIFENRRFSAKTKQQLAIEGVLLIVLGISGIILFSRMHPQFPHYQPGGVTSSPNALRQH